METKYYRPGIEEFHEGFIYEEFIHSLWTTKVFSLTQNIQLDNVRIKILDKEDMISLKFTCNYYNEIVNMSSFENDSFVVNIRHQMYDIFPDVNIYYKWPGKPDNRFSGRIKNISEFKRVLNQVTELY